MPSADGARSRSARPGSPAPLSWRVNLWLFLATAASCFFTVYIPEATRASALEGLSFAGALMAILLAHEFGHYFAARIHKVDASLPFFIPLPVLSPFGTMGAVIRMRAVIPTRRALLDIGAAGPLAGLVVAIPTYAWGVAHSTRVIADGIGAGAGTQLGDSLLLKVLDHFFAPSTPQGTDVMLSPVAWAGWAGMFVTMINLLPVGQLDAGHVSYALFGPRQDRIAQWVHRSMLVFFFVSVASFLMRDVRAGFGLYHLGRHVANSLFWLVWFEVLAILGTFASHERDSSDVLGVGTRAVATLGLALLAGVLHDKASPVAWLSWFGGLGVLLAMEVRGGVLRRSSRLLDHPPTGAQPLGTARKVVAIVTLVFFVLLFMPTPFGL